MSVKGDWHRPHDTVKYESGWMEAFGPKWEARLLDGTVIGTAKSYELAKQIGLDSTGDDVTFSVINVRG